MSTQSLDIKNQKQYLWENDLDINSYITASYYFETSIDPLITAIGMAREQSASNWNMPGLGTVDRSVTARVIKVSNENESNEKMLPTYHLNTPVYEEQTQSSQIKAYTVEIAFPIVNIGISITNIWNFAAGELHRLGFLNAIKLLDISFPEDFINKFSGPNFGIEGIRKSTKIYDRPLFCRSCRPAVGLTTSKMVDINEKVLSGGFDIIKDDELSTDNTFSPYVGRIEQLTNLVKKLSSVSKKLYFANIIEDFSKCLDMAKIAVKNDVDGLIISPAIQGLSMLEYISKETGIIILSHNTFQDSFTRHPRFGISEALYCKMQRLAGADLIMLPNAFGDNNQEYKDCLDACIKPLGNLKPSMPILAGGKEAQYLETYLKDIGSIDFMLIVAAAVDNHPQGIEAGAKQFISSWNQINKINSN